MTVEPPDLPRPDRQVHVVAAALVDDLERPRTLLAARRTAPERLRGQWELPGGKVEPGEEPRSALHRELAEELGVAVDVGELLAGPLGDLAWPLAPGLRMSVWFAVVTDGEPRCLQDHDALRILRADSLDTVPWLESNTAVVGALRATLSPPGPPRAGPSPRRG